MSSINKSRTHFIPKLGKRRKISTKNYTPTVPQPSNKSQKKQNIHIDETQKTKDTDENEKEDKLQKVTADNSTQVSFDGTKEENKDANVSKDTDTKNIKSKRTVTDSTSEVPFIVSTTSKTESARRPSLSSSIISRRASSVSRSRRPSIFGVPSVKTGRSRRLSSLKTSNTTVSVSTKPKSRRNSLNIVPPLFGSRRSSVTSIRGAIPEDANTDAINTDTGTKPVKISVPSSPPRRRRRSSAIVSRRSSVTRESTNVKISASQMDNVLKDLERVDENVSSRLKSSSNVTEPHDAKLENVKIEQKSDANKEKKAKVEAKKEKEEEVELTPSELKKGVKYYIDKKKNQIKKIELSKRNGNASSLESNTNVITDISQLRGLTHQDDMDLLEKFTVDEKALTMKDLCKPFFPIGKVSKDFHLATSADKKRMKERAEKREKRLLARKLRVPLEKVEGENETKEKEQERRRKIKEFMDKEVNESDNHRMVPLLVTNDDGTVTYSHESTYVDRHSETANDGAMERVVENPYENLVTSGSYSKRRYVERWTPQETAELYKALSTWGTDFGLIAQLFPYRTRRQVKSKFNFEESKHPHLIEFALLRKLPGNLSEYAGKAGKEYNSLDHYESQLKELRNKHEKEIKALTAAKQQAQAEDRSNAKRNSSIPTKVTAKSRKAVLMEFRKNEEVVGSIPPKAPSDQ